MADINIIINSNTLEKYNTYYFSKYPKRKKLPIESPLHPSMNKWMVMRRPQMNDLKQKWKEFGLWLLKEKNLDGLHIDKCKITITFYFKDKRRIDLDNRSPKFLFDAFVEGGLLIDDSYFHVNPLVFIGKYDKEMYGMVITIRVLED
jgi:Holliday junction resolvase RusA-like endonuclease